MIDLLNRFPGCPVLVVGDLMLDEFIWGHVSRISPEAPVPVVEVQRRTFTAGGAANTAANLAALGAVVTIAGIVGYDAEGDRIVGILQNQKIATSAVVKDASRPTTTKTRVVAHSQQMVRIDHEKPGAMADMVEAELFAAVAKKLSHVRSCVVSDYGKGVITPSFVGRLIAAARAANVPVIVDPKGTDYLKYRGATLVKPNQLEAGKVLNRDLKTTEEVDAAGRELQRLLGGETAILITRGAHGMALMEPHKPTVNVPTQAREVYDVTGAGDTVAGALALALAVGGTLETACKLASLAAAVVVGKVGTATCDLNELRNAAASAKW
jgi:D-beta-D-heptose 7-phosphate kinase/D-beta-D-heptose 1-phosphate adenosyltransferase